MRFFCLLVGGVLSQELNWLSIEYFSPVEDHKRHLDAPVFFWRASDICQPLAGLLTGVLCNKRENGFLSKKRGTIAGSILKVTPSESRPCSHLLAGSREIHARDSCLAMGQKYRVPKKPVW